MFIHPGAESEKEATGLGILGRRMGRGVSTPIALRQPPTFKENLFQHQHRFVTWVFGFWNPLPKGGGDH